MNANIKLGHFCCSFSFIPFLKRVWFSSPVSIDVRNVYSFQCINRCDLPVVPWYYSGIGTTGIGHTILAEMGALYWNVTCWIVDSLLICSAVTASLVRTNLFIQYWDASSTFSHSDICFEDEENVDDDIHWCICHIVFYTKLNLQISIRVGS